MLKASSCNCSNKKGHNWSCTDLEIQRLVIRSIDAFLDCISSETARNPLVKVCNDKWRRCMLVSLYMKFMSNKNTELYFIGFENTWHEVSIITDTVTW